MNKLIYLFEFDSVRNSPDEIRDAHNALFNEVLINGNNVVFAFNQLSDSIALTCLLYNERTYEIILNLFKLGTLKISRYRNYRTAAQYILNGVENCLSDTGDSFYFSGLPLVSSDRTLLMCMKDALLYSDPNSLLECAAEHPEKSETLEFLYKYVKFILAISQTELSYNPANLNKTLTFSEIIDSICNTYLNRHFPYAKITETFFKAIDVLNQIKKLRVTNSRTNWLQVLSSLNTDPKIAAVCEGVIHLCYNYTVEDSISGCSKRYEKALDSTFFDDFERRFVLWWEGFCIGLHKPHHIDTPDVDFPAKSSHINWGTALRTIVSVSGPLSIFRKRIHSLFMWKILIGVGMIFRLLTIPVFVGGFIITEYLLSTFIEYGRDHFLVYIQNRIVLNGIAIAISGVISSLATKVTKLPDMLESFCALFFIFIDLLAIVMFNIRRVLKRRPEYNERFD